MHRGSVGLTRRGLLATALAAPAAAAAQPSRGAAPIFAYVGSYTDASTPAGHGQGISLWTLDAGSGALTAVKTFPAASPSWLALDPQKKFLFACNEVDSYGPDKTGSASAYRFDPASGDLAPIDTVSARGRGTTHGSVHPSGKFFFVANYGAGSFAVLPIGADGALAEASDGPIGEAALPLGRYDRRLLARLERADYTAIYTSDRFPAKPGSWMQARYSATSDSTVDGTRRIFTHTPALRDAWQIASSLAKRVR